MTTILGWITDLERLLAVSCSALLGGGLYPPRRIQFTPDESNEAYLRFEIERASGGCLFRLIDKMGPAADAVKILGADTPKHLVYQPGGIGTHWSGVVSGFHRFVDLLETHVSGNAPSSNHDDLSRRYMTVLDEWHA